MLAMAAERLERDGRANFTGACGGAESLPFADAAFDVVFMIAVPGEVPDRASAVREAARVLRPGGCFSSTFIVVGLVPLMAKLHFGNTSWKKGIAAGFLPCVTTF